VLLGPTPVIPAIDFDKEKDLLKFSFTEPLTPSNSLKLKIEFDGNFSSSLMGHYLSKYRDLNGDWKTLTMTQFESCFCRTVSVAIFFMLAVYS
jgi:aminopeptidase N